MNMKFFFLFLFTVCSLVVSAQSYRYENKNELSTETVSFDLSGNKIVDGEWEHVSNDPNTSGEVYGFSGKRSGNKLIITFTGTVPYAIPNRTKTKKGTWVFSDEKIVIQLKQKSKTVNATFMRIKNSD